MTRLISQYEADFGPSEEDEAVRLRADHGWARACTLVSVFEVTCPRPYRAFWFRVQALLAAQNDGVLPGMIRKEREAQRPPPARRFYLEVGGVRISRAEFMLYLKTKRAKA